MSKIETNGFDFKISDLFNSDYEYIIPIYQRAYEWEKEQIEQLIFDINKHSDLLNGNKYYLGSLIVARKSNTVFEVIDGQQRLTTLYLLFKYLINNSSKGENITINNKVLRFEYRNSSNDLLDKLSTDENIFLKSENSITCGYKIIKNYFNKNKINIIEFIKKLENVMIFRIPVPEKTDLNHYFEVMNTRGEQLRQTDIVKSELMESLTGREDYDFYSALFSNIWNAIYDMDHYVQLGFKTDLRELMFGNNYNETTSIEYIFTEDFKKLHQNENDLKADSKNTTKISILDIIQDKTVIEGNIKDDKDDFSNNGYNSIINFEYFLLHALRVFCKINNVNIELSKMIDDEKIIKDFKSVKEAYIGENFSLDFITFLLKLRYIFDKYIIKRYYTDNIKDGNWTLKYFLHEKTGKKHSYKYLNTFKNNENKKNRKEETCSTDEKNFKRCVLLQSCLRVSFTSPYSMHWITDILTWLYKNYKYNGNDDNIKCCDFIKVLDNYILFGKCDGKSENDSKTETINNYIDEGNFSLGLKTPNIVLNYLDYLLWENDDFWDNHKNQKYKNAFKNRAYFKFEYRNSVEHWYPQNPEGSEIWENKDCFGNLALLQRNINSKFSNLTPAAKKEYALEYQKRNESLSLKLLIMADMTNDESEWRNNTCKIHQDEMLQLLKNKCQK